MMKAAHSTGKRDGKEALRDNGVVPDKEYTGTVDKGMADLTQYLFSTFNRNAPVSVDEFNERVYEYFTVSIECGCVPGKPGLALACGWANWEAMDNCMADDSNALVVHFKRALEIMHQLVQELTVRGRIGALFLLKSSWGHSDMPKNAGQFLPSLNFLVQINGDNIKLDSPNAQLSSPIKQLQAINQE